MKLWNKEKREVKLAKFTDSTMKKDTGDGYSEVHNFWRKKTYTKEYDMMKPAHLRDFNEPYSYAAAMLGGNWNMYNAPFIVQVGKCNLNCHFCFVDEKLRNLKNPENYKDFTAKEVVNLWRENTKGKGILRISGGEPFLAPDFIKDVCRYIYTNGLSDKCFLWIDTNLLGNEYKEVVKYLDGYEELKYGICGCFKGFDPYDFKFNTGVWNENINLHKQFENAKLLVDTAKNDNIFFYVPEITSEPINLNKTIKNFIEKMQDKIHPYAPLRTTILKIKEYKTNKDTIKKRYFSTGYTKLSWLGILKEIYSTELLWLPQYQVSLTREGW
jgi:uncharacterized Fe-S cluster-containing radical SAM superfamily protein